MGEPERAVPGHQPREHARPDPSPREVAPGRQPIAVPRQQRSRIDSLAIGSPLAAAFVGALLAKGGGATEEGGSGADLAGAGVVRGQAAGGAVPPDAPLGTLPENAPLPDMLALQEATLASAAMGAEHAVGPAEVAAGSLAPAVASLSAPEASASLSAKAGTSSAPNYTYSFGSGGDAGVGGTGLEETAAPFVDTGPGDIGSLVVGSEGDDLIIGTANDDRLFGEDGDDTIFGREGDDLLDGGAGDDRLFGEQGNDVLLGQTGNDLLDGGPGNDDLFGGEGDDILRGQAGRDDLDGGPGDDILDGGQGFDVASGGAGNDATFIDHFHDLALEDGRGVDFGGIDSVVVEQGFWESLRADPTTSGLLGLNEDGVTFRMHDNLSPGALPSGVSGYLQQLDPHLEGVTLRGSAAHDVVGNASANRLFGNDGANRLYGGDNDDILDGRGGNDLLEGGAGNDILRGFLGADTLRGGLGDDTYRLSADNAETVRISDNAGSNRIEFEDGLSAGAISTREIGGDLFIFAEGHDSPVAIVSNYDPSKMVLDEGLFS